MFQATHRSSKAARTAAASSSSAGSTSPADPRAALTAIAHNPLTLLLGDVPVALNRMAVASPELAGLLLRHGRHTTGPLVAAFLSRLADQGPLHIDDPEDAFQLRYGLVVRDLQIRALLGEHPPTGQDLRVQALDADRFPAPTAR
ncbi:MULTISPECIES: TetR/AcrR family transcriptional regulator C-terminal domain-containing protein [unclassified Nocardiopsis]|uniref:TetR/AcrR family transcriptional regulator C-terminal domain-containing protein n=1 Tax=unclassified Nocardiopsis TaxID=2649073 RepID=UPI001F439967|nr:MULTISPECIES: TetR/AcrR family transcriptional regulator C-terminal domain-containing protein [unclassified Nocardiopsis]